MHAGIVTNIPVPDENDRTNYRSPLKSQASQMHEPDDQLICVESMVNKLEPNDQPTNVEPIEPIDFKPESEFDAATEQHQSHSPDEETDRK